MFFVLQCFSFVFSNQARPFNLGIYANCICTLTFCKIIVLSGLQNCSCRKKIYYCWFNCCLAIVTFLSQNNYVVIYKVDKIPDFFEKGLESLSKHARFSVRVTFFTP